MATSGSFNWTLTRDNILKRALAKVGNSNPNVNDISDASDVLNGIMKAWQNDSVFVWTYKWESKPLDTASAEVIGTDGKNYRCILGHTAAAANQPITGSDWPTFWIEGGSAGAAWVATTVYGSIGDFNVPADTMYIERAYVRDGNSDIPLEIGNWGSYFSITDKAHEGTPTFLFLDMELTPRVILWPLPERIDYVLHYLRVQLIEDFDISANTPDSPTRWIDAMVYAVAADLADDYGLAIAERQILNAKAVAKYGFAKGGERIGSAGNIVAPSYSARRRRY